MPGHKDPEGIIEREKDGKLFVKVIDKKEEKKEDLSKFDLNNDGKLDEKDVGLAEEVIKKTIPKKKRGWRRK